MNITDISIKNPVFAWMLMASTILFGLVAVTRVGISQYPDVDPIWHYGYLFSPALTLGGGTFAVQRNIVAEQVLGLPREPDVEHGMAWTETRARKALAS